MPISATSANFPAQFSATSLRAKKVSPQFAGDPPTQGASNPQQTPTATENKNDVPFSTRLNNGWEQAKLKANKHGHIHDLLIGCLLSFPALLLNAVIPGPPLIFPVLWWGGVRLFRGTSGFINGFLGAKSPERS